MRYIVVKHMPNGDYDIISKIDYKTMAIKQAKKLGVDVFKRVDVFKIMYIPSTKQCDYPYQQVKHLGKDTYYVFTFIDDKRIRLFGGMHWCIYKEAKYELFISRKLYPLVKLGLLQEVTIEW